MSLLAMEGQTALGSSMNNAPSVDLHSFAFTAAWADFSAERIDSRSEAMSTILLRRKKPRRAVQRKEKCTCPCVTGDDSACRGGAQTDAG